MPKPKKSSIVNVIENKLTENPKSTSNQKKESKLEKVQSAPVLKENEKSTPKDEIVQPPRNSGMIKKTKKTLTKDEIPQPTQNVGKLKENEKSTPKDELVQSSRNTVKKKETEKLLTKDEIPQPTQNVGKLKENEKSTPKDELVQSSRNTVKKKENEKPLVKDETVLPTQNSGVTKRNKKSLMKDELGQSVQNSGKIKENEEAVQSPQNISKIVIDFKNKPETKVTNKSTTQRSRKEISVINLDKCGQDKETDTSNYEDMSIFLEDKIIKYLTCARAKRNVVSDQAEDLENKINFIYELFIEKRHMSDRVTLEKFRSVFSKKMFFIEELDQWWYVLWVPDVMRSRLHYLKSINFPMKLLETENEFVNYCRSKNLSVTMLQYTQYAQTKEFRDDDIIARIFVTYSIHVRMTEILWSNKLSFNIRAYLVSDISEENVRIVAKLLRALWKDELKSCEVKFNKVETWLAEKFK